MLDCFRFHVFLLDVQANPPETSPFLSAQITAEHILLSVYSTYLGCITLAAALATRWRTMR